MKLKVIHEGWIKFSKEKGMVERTFQENVILNKKQLPGTGRVRRGVASEGLEIRQELACGEHLKAPQAHVIPPNLHRSRARRGFLLLAAYR